MNGVTLFFAILGLTGWVAPEADLDARFPMTCGETGDLLQVDGWMFEVL